MRNNKDDLTKTCSHIDTIDDHHTGDVICCKCGLIRDNICEVAFTESDHPIDLNVETNDVDERPIREFIIDVCDILQIRSSFLVNCAISIFFEIGGTLTFGRCRAKLAFAIWEALNRHGTPRSPREIATLCNVSPKSMQRIEKSSQLKCSFIQPIDYVDTIGKFLYMPWPIINIIKLIVLELQDEFASRRPEIFIAAIILKNINNTQALNDLATNECKKIMTPASMSKILGLKWKNVKSFAEKIPKYEIRANENSLIHHRVFK